MDAAPDEPLPTAPFDEFYGVVLTHVHSGPLRWSRIHQGWLRRRGVLGPFVWADEPVEDDRIDLDEHAAALELITDFVGSRFCSRCWRAPRPETHYVALDVLGDPAIFCVQQPAYEVVDSGGGTGTKKHLGGPSGCRYAEPALVTGPIDGVGEYGIVAGFVYGEPLVADEAMLRMWCDRCATVAWRARESGATPYDLETHQRSVDNLARIIANR